jgi:hypothetical protein
MGNINRQNWNVLNWNLRRLNSADKCNAIREKIEESDCALYCVQETKVKLLNPSRHIVSA